jgi:hypothetical protein
MSAADSNNATFPKIVEVIEDVQGFSADQEEVYRLGGISLAALNCLRTRLPRTMHQNLSGDTKRSRVASRLAHALHINESRGPGACDRSIQWLAQSQSS